MTQLRILGATRITHDDQTVTTQLGGVKPRQLLELLALTPGTPVSKEALANQLWEGREPRAYAASLESHISVARRHLRQAGLAPDTVRTVTSGYVLADVTVDVAVLLDRLRDVAAVPAVDAPAVVEELPVAPEPLLASSPYATWAVAARETLHHAVAAACRHAARGAMALHQPERAVDLAERAQQADPLSEATEQVLIEAYGAAGARSDALRSFADFRERMHDELGVEPSTTTQSLYLDVLCAGGMHQVWYEESERAVLRRLLGQLPARDRTAAPA